MTEKIRIEVGRGGGGVELVLGRGRWGGGVLALVNYRYIITREMQCIFRDILYLITATYNH